MKPYIHKVQYYETDQMSITHHSNYIRWMEEARVEYLEELDWGYDKIESLGIVSPVLHVECDYKKTTTFADQIQIEVRLTDYRCVKFEFNYTLTNIKTNEIVCTGKTRHCFLHKDGNPVFLPKEFPELHVVLLSELQ